MKKLNKSFLMISLLVLCIGIWSADAATLWKSVPPKNYVTFNWTDETNKQFWVNNSYINCWFDGTQGGLLINLYHKSNPTKDLMEDDKMLVTGPMIGSQSSRSSVKNVSVTYVNVSLSFAKIVVSSVDNGENLNFTYTYYIGDSESIMVDYRVTFLKGISVTSISHEFAPNYAASKGSFLAFTNKTGYLNTWKLTADGSYTTFANSTAGTFPLGEDWMAIWNTTRNVCVGQIYTNQLKLLNPLNRTLVGLWDGSGEVASWYSKWYEGPATSISAGSMFDDSVLLWFGAGDYTDVRNLAGMANEILDPDLWTTVPPKNYVTFNWKNQTLKRFWVNNSYIRCFFNGTWGGALNDVYHKSDLTKDLFDTDHIIIRAVPRISSMEDVPLGNVNVSYTQVSPSFAKLVVIGISPLGINFTRVYHFGDSEAIRVDIKVTFLKDISADEMGHEFVVEATKKSQVAYMNHKNALKIWNITGFGFHFLAQYIAGEFPLAENWVAIWDSTRNVCVGQIYLNQSMLNPLGQTAIALWDGVVEQQEVALCNRWWQGASKLMKTGSVLEDEVIFWFGTGDYMDVKNKDGTTSELRLYTPPPPPPPPKELHIGWFHMMDVANKRFWVNNSYINCWFEGTQGAILVDVRHISDLTKDLIEDDKMVVEGPEIGWRSSRWGIPMENISVNYTQFSPSFGRLVVTSIVSGINFTYIYYFTNSEAIKVTHKVTFLTDINVTQMGHEFVPAYVASVGSDVAYVNSTGYLNTWKLTGSGNDTILANTTAGAFPMAEDWIAVWNTTRNLCAGLMYYNQSVLLNPLGKTTIGVHDGAKTEWASLFSRWYQGPNATISAGSEFEDTVLFWFGPGDYTDVRNLAGMIDGIPGRITWNLTTVSKAGLEVYKTFLHGANLTVKFYSYSGDYQAESTVWTGATPALVSLSVNVTHPLGQPVENATLVLTDNLGSILYTVTGFVVSRSDLMGRLGELDYLWTVPGADRSAIMKEYVAIDGQWPYAPPSWVYVPPIEEDPDP